MNILKKLLGMGPKVSRDLSLGRNDDCWCGSGKKYKKCHMEQDEPLRDQARKMGCKSRT
jgi:hypothetical protein